MINPIALRGGRDHRPSKNAFRSRAAKIIVSLLLSLMASVAFAGTWSDDFSANVIGPQWRGDRDHFAIFEGALNGISASPLAPVPLRWIEVGSNWDDYVVQCRMNVVTPNLAVCTKGALILRHNGNEGYVFALHVATKTVEVYRLSDQEMLLSQPEPLELQRWYRVRAELQGETMSFFLDDKPMGQITDKRSASGSVGLAVQDAMSVLFDDFTVTGPKVQNDALNILRAGNQIILGWPTTGVIQTADTLTPPIQWAPLTNAPVASGNQNILALGMDGGCRFYWLNP
jgi:hypothetical protein